MDKARLDEYIDAWLVHPAAGAAEGGKELTQLLGLMSSDVRYEDVPSGSVFFGHEGIRDMCTAAYNWSSDVKMNVTSCQTDGSSFAIEVVTSGTNTGPMGNSPATGKAFSHPMASVGKFDSDGLVIAHRDYWDLFSFLGQIGLLRS
jgi:steroid delta-isomerase-like uncharacterized protein